ncbi:hypothetical protein [Sediminibacterium ginsengisoli]|uniref:HPr Serine kinase C-terminal domain-containing protein n=1 Tax=Sediminibacterium ginsengisoli TaxID=413434 RepID=A0A1T4QB13_9BACT|nr:hypothetical protein [Sediminibacterium ginsengisoli]SKA00919.1 hypothetical protein SAMN04488132_10818 [Sediminibacterium ginsengisoli]
MYNYWAFGLRIHSDIAFPELLPFNFNGDADVIVQLGEVAIAGKGWNISADEFSFSIRDVAKYYVASGKTIVAEPLEQVDVTNVTALRPLRLYLLSTAFAAIITQRGQIPLHASAIEGREGLTLIAGDSGAGKSVTLATLSGLGHKIFSDDIIVMKKMPDAEDLLAFASYPMVKLWSDSLEKLQQDRFSDRSFPIKPGMDKYGIFFHDAFDRTGKQVKNIVLLKRKTEGPVTVTALTGKDAFAAIRNQLYRPMLVFTIEARMILMKTIAALIESCNIYEITRPEICDPFELATVILNITSENKTDTHHS